MSLTPSTSSPTTPAPDTTPDDAPDTAVAPAPHGTSTPSWRPRTSASAVADQLVAARANDVPRPRTS